MKYVRLSSTGVYHIRDTRKVRFVGDTQPTTYEKAGCGKDYQRSGGFTFHDVVEGHLCRSCQAMDRKGTINQPEGASE